MIEGIKIEVQGEELVKLLEVRIKLYSKQLEKAEEKRKQEETYLKELKKLSKDDYLTRGRENRPVKTKVLNRRKKIEYLTFLRDHINIREVYLLNTSDLSLFDLRSY